VAAGASPVKPEERDDGFEAEFRLAISKSAEERFATRFGNQRLAAGCVVQV
jgi:hypothetical protein